MVAGDSMFTVLFPKAIGVVDRSLTPVDRSIALTCLTGVFSLWGERDLSHEQLYLIFLCANLHKSMWQMMLYTDFLSELGKVGLSVRAFAELTGMNPNSISNYARTGELPTHLALIAVLIVGLAEVGGDYRRIMSKVQLAPKKPRGSGRQGHFGGDKQADLDLK